MEQNLSQYRIFYAVAKAGNISRAAKELYISQPAVSKAIRKLEESLNTTLFKRNSRGKNRKFQPDSCFKIKHAETSNKITGCFTPDISIFLRKQQVIFTSKSFNIKVVFNYYRDLACKNPKQIQVCH